DATASYFGGYTVTDNRERKILRSGDVESLNAVILIPSKKVYTTKVDLSKIGLIKNSVQAAWEMAMKGEIYTAMTLNGFLHAIALNYSPEIQMEALKAGAIAAVLSGKGPAVIALTRGDTKKIKKALSQFEGKIIETKTNNTQAYILK
ncbi:MAG: shikimate kinase, partial [Candidatus Altiarchaeales archaeon]|nr:shikimate kinase [Candidatus Altiarchaeales archaeon]